MFSRIRSLPHPVTAVLFGGTLLVLLVLALQTRAAPLKTPAGPTTATPRPSARGELQPVSQAKVGTLNGGILASLAVAVGEGVREKQEIGRVQGPAGTEVLTAPWAGTITGMLAHVGDTVIPGAIVATVADLSRLQVETTDVDEFIVAHIVPRQAVTVAVEALDFSEFQGYVRSVALQPQVNSTGDRHYPVIIDLAETTPDLRAGMSVRVYFSD